jgi:CheY-like chemotaxis protein
MDEGAGGDSSGWSGAQLEGCVLVVDDEPDVRETLCDMVEMVGCLPIEARNGAEALELLRARRPCLMILDVLMPVMSGTELLQAMKLEPALADVAVVVSTSAPDRVPPGVPVVRKPIDLPVMLEWMRRTCRCASRPAGAGEGEDKRAAALKS